MDLEGEYVQLATPARRLGAYVLDGIIVSLISLVIFFAFGTSDGHSWAALLPLSFLAWLVMILWFLSNGTTPGKKMLGLRVAKEDTGVTAGLGTMLLREIIGKWISALFLYIGFAWILIDNDHQGWHDKLASTIVVQD